jgi:hypothetical protein
MAADAGFRPRDPGHWVDALRQELLSRTAAPDSSRLYDQAHDAGPVDAVTMFAYFEGRLSPEERAAVEAEVAASPASLRKFTFVAAEWVRAGGDETAD